MAKTGESYTAARASLLAGPDEDGKSSDAAVMPQSDAAVRERTGKGWEEWLAELDDWGANERTHTEIARHLREFGGVEGWWAQSITLGYERARGRRAVGENAEGFVARATKMVNVPVAVLYDGFMDETGRSAWLAEDELRIRTTTRPRSARFDWGDGRTRVIVDFAAKGEAKCVVSVSHERLPDAEEAERMKSMWRSSVAELKEVLER